jgi:hypothetical protein
MATPRPHFALSYQLDAPMRRLLAVQLNRQMLRGRFVVTYLGIVVALFILLAGADYQAGSDLIDALTSLLPLAIGIALFPLLGYAITSFRIGELAKKFPELSFEFYDTYFTNRTQGTEGKVDYSVIDQLIITKAGYLLKFNRQFFFLPAAQVSPELAKLLTSKIPTKRKRRRQP